MEMVKKLIDYILENVDNEEIRFTYSKMCIERCDLPRVNWCLYNDIENLVDDFIADNELSDEWFETEVGLIEDLFDDVLKRLD